MRRIVGLALLGLGVLMLAAAPLLRWYAYPGLAVTTDEIAEREFVGRDVTILDSPAVAEARTPVTRATEIKGVRKIVPDVSDGTDRVAVWETSLLLVDLLGAGASPEENVVAYQETRLGFDRRTGENVSEHGAYVTTTGRVADRERIEPSGHFFRLPYETRPDTYALWDPVLRDVRPLEFDGQTRLHGLPVYRFVQQVEPTSVATLDVPGPLFGQPGAVQAERVYSVTRTVWVEPRTGQFVDVREDVDSYLTYQGERGPELIQGVLEYSDAQVATLADELGSTAARLDLVKTRGPLLAAGVGLVALVAGLLLGRRRRSGERPAMVERSQGRRARRADRVMAAAGPEPTPWSDPMRELEPPVARAAAPPTWPPASGPQPRPAVPTAPAQTPTAPVDRDARHPATAESAPEATGETSQWRAFDDSATKRTPVASYAAVFRRPPEPVANDDPDDADDAEDVDDFAEFDEDGEAAARARRY